jgi:hypothetical protein
MERKHNPIFDEVIQACEEKGFKLLIGFKQCWNKELIAKFYALVYFGYVLNERGENERAMFLMIGGDRFQLTFSTFLTLFRLPQNEALRKLHDEGVLETKRMSFMATIRFP